MSEIPRSTLEELLIRQGMKIVDLENQIRSLQQEKAWTEAAYKKLQAKLEDKQ